MIPINMMPNSIFLRNNDISRKSFFLVRIAVVVAIVLAAIIVTACLMSPISYIIGGVLGIVAIGVLAATIISEIKRTPKNLPKGFLDLLKNTYPAVVYNLVVQEHLTLSELREVLDILKNVKKSGDLASRLFNLSERNREKISRFGVKNLEQGVLGMELPPLEPFLRKHCPFYMLKTLINMGDKSILKSRGCDEKYQGCYWLGAAALGGGNQMLGLFDLRIPIIMNSLDKKDFDFLKQHVDSSSWKSLEVQRIIDGLVDKCKGKQPATTNNASKGVQCFPLDKDNISKVLHRLCWVGYSWEQLQLILEMNAFDYWSWFCFFDGLGRMGKNLCFIVGLLYMEGILDETSKAYSPNVLLMTLNEIQEAYAYGQSSLGSKKFGRQSSQVTENMIDYIAAFLSPHLRQVLKTKNIAEAIDEMIKVTSNIE